MNYQSFLEEVRIQLGACVGPEVDLFIQSMPGNNGTSCDSLILQYPLCNIAPAVCLTPYYHRYLEGVSLEDICSDILDTCRRQQPSEYFDTSRYTDFSKVKSRIVMRLVSYPRNEWMLADVPHVCFLDLAVIFYCLLYAGSDSQASILIRNDHLKLWDADIDTVCRLAEQNTPVLLPQQVTPMYRLLDQLVPAGGILPEHSRDLPIYVATNSYRTNGASAIFYDRLLRQTADRFTSDLILLPSSIHEFLLLPAEDSSDLEAYGQMVREVNETQLADDEVLADHAYYYDRKRRLITM